MLEQIKSDLKIYSMLNAIQYSVSYEHELYRVIAHAILHLAGYNDKSLNEKKIIKERENHYLKFITI